ncbi:MAG: transcriptional regulator [Candidatus Bathyarchaeota archaeon]|nr:transcriptional regulator [Candidatus Bathyarchaeota archaeon]MDH5713275.1 transcriptional regulator [Candidatus Bathyarchaeota archaeon]
MKGNEARDDELPSISKIDKTIHEPARLMIMAHLFVVESADFLFLQRQTGLTWGNLSSHLSKLENAGYVAIEKEFIDKKPHTTLHLTDKGRTAFQEYRQSMKQVFDDLSV